MATATLKVGFFSVDKDRLPAWEYEMVVQLLESEFVSELIFMYNSADSTVENHSFKKSFILNLFNVFENFWFKKQSDASAMVEIQELKKYGDKVRILELSSKTQSSSFEIDLIYTGYPKCRLPQLFTVPRLGIWYIHFGKGKISATNSQPGFWEVMRREETSHIQLKVTLNGVDHDKIAYHSIGTTVPFSVKNNFNAMAWKACFFLPARLRTICLTSPEHFFNNCEMSEVLANTPPNEIRYSNPSNLQMFTLFFQNGFGYLLNKLKQYIKNKRFILFFSQTEKDVFLADINKFIAILPQKNTFWADPFVIEKDMEKFIFFEEGLLSGGKAWLSVLKMNSDGNLGEARKVLERPHHLSYPFIFEHEDNFYLIPETSEIKSLELYRAVQFPLEWEFVRYLLVDVEFQDPTLFYHQETWWLFGTTKTSKSSTSNDQLLIYYAKNLSDEWIPHSGNPVITDVSNCRPAGKIFAHAGKIYRPAQNNASDQYGYAIWINEIEILNQSEYREKPVLEISPRNHNKFIAMHTINFSSELMVIDGIKKRKSIFRS